MSQIDRIDQAAEEIVDQAKLLGERAGLTATSAALEVLTMAYAKAIADAVNFAEDPARLQVAVDTVNDRTLNHVKMQVLLRKMGRHRRNG